MSPFTAVFNKKYEGGAYLKKKVSAMRDDAHLHLEWARHYKHIPCRIATPRFSPPHNGFNTGSHVGANYFECRIAILGF